ncbi:DUF952 domain-containing protein [Roseomonas sp. CCTCC AB2023176]|uniref:DUF952 domain-containing protein n=1 Tax=Roseomonas sp. CCTCC AB2023176 TaxID=3342640 RepID=UPI0035D87BC3
MADPIVHKLMTGAEWRAMRDDGLHRGGEHDRRDGYIHLSTTAQVRESAAKHRTGESDLWLVCLDAAALGAALRWEAASGGKRPGLFPHLYGDMPLAAVRGRSRCRWTGKGGIVSRGGCREGGRPGPMTGGQDPGRSATRR